MTDATTQSLSLSDLTVDYLNARLAEWGAPFDRVRVSHAGSNSRGHWFGYDIQGQPHRAKCCAADMPVSVWIQHIKQSIGALLND